MCFPVIVESNRIALAPTTADQSERIICFFASDQKPSGGFAEWDVYDLTILRWDQIWFSNTRRLVGEPDGCVHGGHVECGMVGSELGSDGETDSLDLLASQCILVVEGGAHIFPTLARR